MKVIYLQLKVSTNQLRQLKTGLRLYCSMPCPRVTIDISTPKPTVKVLNVGNKITANSAIGLKLFNCKTLMNSWLAFHPSQSRKLGLAKKSYKSCSTIASLTLQPHVLAFLRVASTTKLPYKSLELQPSQTLRKHTHSHDLVGGFNHSEKYEFVSWDDEIPNMC